MTDNNDHFALALYFFWDNLCVSMKIMYLKLHFIN